MGTINFLQNEYWFGGLTDLGKSLPIDSHSVVTINLANHGSQNQASPVFVSTKGRYIFSEDEFLITFNKGVITIESCKEVMVGQGEPCLRGAYLAVQQHFMPSGYMPNKLMFTAPQYCTWIELMYNQTQQGILSYAQSIINSGMPAGELIIDDNWQVDYGNWQFNAEFPNAKEMVSKLKDMGFKVILWIAPYISPDSAVFRQLETQGLLVKNADGSTAVRRWWNGYSAVLDFTNPSTSVWFETQCNNLRNNYGIDGFKLDGGDAYMYHVSDITFAPTTPNGQTRAWAEQGLLYDFNELRACWGLSGRGIAQRLCDKQHKWSELATLIPNAINMGLIGHPFCCPDMVGGGSFADFEEGKPIDEELCIRWLQASVFMPMMQYSFALWNRLSVNGRQIAIRFARLRAKLGDYFLTLAKEASVSGEPIIRSLEYQFGNSGFHAVKDCFMVGKYLVAPVLDKGQTTKRLCLPKGKWLNMIDGKAYCGEHVFNVGLENLLYFEALEAIC